MKYNNVIFRQLYKILIIFFCIFNFTTLAKAKLILNIPDKVAKGDAFVAEVSSDTPTNFFIFNWNGKDIQIQADNNFANLDSQNYHAKVLLPVPLDDKGNKKSISVRTGNHTNKNYETIKKSIALYEKKRPVQKLTVDKKFVSPPPEQAARIKRDREKVNKALSEKLPGRLWDIPLERPVPGSISSLFGLKRVFNGQPRGMHKGLDLRGAQGTPIKACADGKVVLVDNLYYSGNTVYINHGDGVFSAYLHMSKPLVQPGENVVRGQTVGLVGSTGRVTGPHLHLSIFSQGQSVDPLPLIEQAPTRTRSSAGNKK